MQAQTIGKISLLMILFFGATPVIGQANTSDFSVKRQRDTQKSKKLREQFRQPTKQQQPPRKANTIAKLPAALTILYNFDTDTPSGGCPVGGLTGGGDGYLYGTTSGCGFLDGTIFKITGNGLFRNLVSFNGNNGSNPSTTLALGPDRNLYGSTEEGGGSRDGSIFKISLTGLFTNLFTFNFFNDGPATPQGKLVLGRDGSWYGTSVYGGKGTNCFGTCGTVFKFRLGGALTTVVNFNDTNGQSPLTGLAPYIDGTLYGTTYGEEDFGNAVDKFGTIFKLTPQTGRLTTLVKFTGLNQGPKKPHAELTYNPNDRYFYGTTDEGGLYGGGTIFKMTPAGSLRVIYNFRKALISDESSRPSRVVVAPDKNMYLTTYTGSNSGCYNGSFSDWGCGAIWRITPSGVISRIYAFTGNADGGNPSEPAVGVSYIYGVTHDGGANYDGVVFRWRL